MRKLIAITLLIAFFSCLSVSATNKDPFALDIKELYSAPQPNANVVFNIPIEVKLLDISDDLEWYKVKIAFGLGLFQYQHTGWVYLPIAKDIIPRAVDLL